MAVAVSVLTQIDALFCATNVNSSNRPALQDPQSTSKTRESEIDQASTENGVGTNQSQVASGNDEEAPINHDSLALKKRNSEEASRNDEEVFTDEDNPANKKRKSGEASGDNEDVSADQDSLASTKTRSGEVSDGEGTLATQVTQSSETESSQATDGLNDCSVKVRLVDGAGGT